MLYLVVGLFGVVIGAAFMLLWLRGAMGKPPW